MLFQKCWHLTIASLNAAYNCLLVYLVGLFCILSERLRWPRDIRVAELLAARNRLVLIIGGTRGIGATLAVQLAYDFGADVIVASNNECDGQRLVSDNPLIEFRYVDLCCSHSVLNFVQQLANQKASIDFLVNSAAVMLTPLMTNTDVAGSTSYELQFTVNFLHLVLLTEKLLPLLQHSSHCKPRIINVGSAVARVGKLPDNIVTLARIPRDEFAAYSSHAAYANSKLCVAAYTELLQRRLQSENSRVSVVCLHPGVVGTQLYQHVCLPIRKLIQLASTSRLHIFTSHRAAATQIVSALLDTHLYQDGKYHENGRVVKLNFEEEQLTEFWTQTRHLLHI